MWSSPRYTWFAKSSGSADRWWRWNWQWQDDAAKREKSDAWWRAAGWEEFDQRAPCGSMPAADSKVEVHAPDQYPWGAVPPSSYNHDGEAPGDLHENPASTGAHADEPAEEPCAPDRQDSVEEELRKLHADALVRFHLNKPCSESGDESAEEPCSTSSSADEVDPEVGQLDPATGEVTCKVCNRLLNSKTQFKEHLKGKKHRKKATAAEERKRREQEPQTAEAASHMLTIRTVTCTSTGAETSQLWGAYVAVSPYQ